MTNGRPFYTVANCMQRFAFLGALLYAVLITSTASAVGLGGIGLGLGRIGVVGGVSVDAEGVLANETQVERDARLAHLRQMISVVDGPVAKAADLRMISLRQLQNEIEKAITNKTELPQEILYLAGLQRIEYVFAVPEKNDIVIAGPAEAWTVRDDASVVGAVSGLPVLHLEDLIVALRSVEAAQDQAISVSIDPTREGELRLEKFLSNVRSTPGFNPAMIESQMKQLLGPQQVSLTSIPSDSRTAMCLVAADYRMKRIAMKLEDSPVAEIPSYLDMIQNAAKIGATQPRWWMACNYDAILRSEDGMAWQLTGQGVKAMTQEQVVTSSGERKQVEKKNPYAEKWSASFTEHFDSLSRANPVFGEVRNIMDMALIATIIRGHEMEKTANCDLGLLTGTREGIKLPTYAVPKTIAPECSFLKTQRGWIMTASGGVELNPWKMVATEARVDSGLAAVSARAKASDDAAWWW